MTDAELIALLTQKSPEELTLDQVELLRRRLSDSPELRESLLAQPSMESYLAEALGRLPIAPQDIVTPAERQQKSEGPSAALVLLLVLPLTALITVVLLNTLGWNREDVAQQPRKPENAAAAPREGAGKGSPAQDKATPDQSASAKGKRGTPRKTQGPSGKTPTAPPASAPPPWQVALDVPGEPPPYTQVAFESFEQGFDVANRDDLTPWFDRVPGAGLRISKLPTQYGRSGSLEGIGRLKCPWLKDSALRLALDNFNRLKMHFFHELEGVTLIYYEDQGYRWAAYATTRDAGKPTPKSWAITATDDERCRRTELRFGGPLELRYHEGELILSRGDIVLVSAPLAGPPTDVFFEGRATVHGISLVRASGAPSLPQPGPVAVQVDRPADLVWTATKPEVARTQPQSDGTLRFAADQARERAECVTPLPKAGLHAVLLELDDVTPGTGVFLGRENGRPNEVVRFYRDRKSGQLVARIGSGSDEWEADFDAPADRPTPLVLPHCWVRLLFGCGNLRWWLSSDGVHWAQPEMAQDGVPPNITSIGLWVVANRPDTHLTLRRIVLRRLAGLASLAEDELTLRAPAIVADSSPAHWLDDALRQKPDEVETRDWLRACTVRALGSGARRELAYPLLEALLDDAADRDLPVAQHLAALDDAMLLCLDLRDGQAMRVAIPSRYVQRGINASDEQGLPAWTTVRQHYYSAPVNTRLQTPTNLDRVIRWELVQAAYRNQPHETLELIRRLRFFQEHRDRPLVDWVESLARQGTGGPPSGEALVRLKDAWREPLIEELSKETYNAMTELRAVLESQAWDDAARLVTSFDPEAALGVAPYVNDKSLLTSLPVAVQLSLEEYPQLRQSLGDRFAALARLRIGQAIAAGDATTIELATVQFAGTQAAAEAHQWLGDRALASGWFARAIIEYERAQQIVPAPASQLLPRIRLAAAMLGRDAGIPVSSPVQFGELSLSPTEFEALVAEMRGRSQSGALAASPQMPTSWPVPQPSGFEVRVRSRLDGPVGDRPQEEVGRRTNQYRVPWADRQIATAAVDDVLYVSNRFQVAAYDLTTGLRTWQSQPPPGQIQRAQDWALIAMKPLVAGDRIFARLLYSSNPLLVCLEKKSGKLLWTAENREREFLVSDPLVVQGQLVTLSISIQQEQQGLLRWCVFDSQTGELLRQRDLVRLRSTWGTRACCEIVPLEDGLIASLGGVTLAIDASGNVRWIRSQLTMPADEDPRWVLQAYQPPLVRGDRLYVAQPGVREVECLAAATGRRQWSVVLPEIVGIIGLSRDLLLVRTESDVRALDPSSGQTRWRHPADELYSFQLLDDKFLLLARREPVPDQNERWQTRLWWLDSATGEPTATTVLAGLNDRDPRLGPLVPYQDRLFTFFGRGQHDPTREVVELIPQGEVEHGLPAENARSAWERRFGP